MTEIVCVPPSAPAAGFTRQVACNGTGAHVNATAPLNPATELNSSGNTACDPAETVAEVFPFAANAKSIPVPVSCKVCGDPAALSTTVKLPIRAPAAVGANATCTLQAAPAARPAPQAFVPAAITKSPVTPILWIASATPPLFVNVTVCPADISPTPVAANPTAPTGDSDTPAGATPVPFSTTVWLRNWSVTVINPVPGPTVFGTNATSIAQLECPFKEFPHPFTTVNAPLVICAAISTSAASPELVSVTCCAALAVFNCSAPKANVNGARASVAGSTPSPVNEVVCVPALSVTVSVPVRVPEAVGANAMPNVHPTFAASVAPHVFAVIVKSPLTTGTPNVADTPPALEIVTNCAALVEPTFVPEKLSVIGVNTIAAGGAPTPVNAAVACPPTTFPYTVNTPARVPVAVGKNVTCTVQLDPAAIPPLAPTQLSVSLKSPEVAICITSISLDHQDFLGDRLDRIAWEKAGIMKPGRPVATGTQPPEVAAVLRACAAETGAVLHARGRDWEVAETPDGLRFDDASGVLDLPCPGLAGAHQIDNAGVAIAALRASGLGVPPGAYAGVAGAVWPGRLQRLTGRLAAVLPAGAELYLDGGHNEGAGQALARQLSAWADRPMHLIVGMKRSKNAAGFLAPLLPGAASVWAVAEPGQHMAMLVDEIVAASGGVARAGPDVAGALRQVAGAASRAGADLRQPLFGRRGAEGRRGRTGNCVMDRHAVVKPRLQARLNVAVQRARVLPEGAHMKFWIVGLTAVLSLVAIAPI